MILPKNVLVSLPLMICDDCAFCDPHIERLYDIFDTEHGTSTQYQLTCTNADGCTYAYERRKEKKDGKTGTTEFVCDGSEQDSR